MIKKLTIFIYCFWILSGLVSAETTLETHAKIIENKSNFFSLSVEFLDGTVVKNII